MMPGADLARIDPDLQKDRPDILPPDGPDPALLDRAIALHQCGRLAEAERNYLTILERQPDDFDARHLLGVLRHQQDRDHEALELIGSVLARYPRSAPALSNLGAVLHRLERYQEALEAYDRALTIRPDDAQALYNRGTALKELDRPDEALQCYDRALALKPDFPDALFNRGAVLAGLRRFDAAIASYERALDIEPCHRLAFSGLLDAALHVCDWARTTKIEGRFAAHIVERQSFVEPFALLGISDDPALHLQCARNYVRDTIKVPPQPWSGEIRRRRGRIRVAYLSADFHRHATAYLAAALFELHNRSQFEVIGVSFGPDDGSAMRARLVRAFDRFHDVRSMSDRDVVELLKSLEIDILVDLKGYTAGCRPGILARRPAPIQVSYLGYPGTMGAEFIDYVIADPIVLPFDQQPFYSEKIVHLPECYQVNDPHRTIAERTPTRQEVGLPDEGFVFCCFNNNYKITAPVFSVWMRLLAAVESSVLWLMGDNGSAANNLRKEAAARGIDPARLAFAGKRPAAEHLARYRLADLFLDTLPYNAHTTASDALWAGLPVLTCRGTAFAGRVAASLLNAIDLPELATDSLEEYEALALRLAAGPPLLRRLRAKLAENRLSHPLFNADRFRVHIESAYVTMWELRQRGESPQSFRVEPQQDFAVPAPSRRAGAGQDSPRPAPLPKLSGPGPRKKRKGPAKREGGEWNASHPPDSVELSALLDQAIALHQSDELAEAERLYRDILDARPDDFDARHLLGIVRHQQGRDAEALDLIGSALEINPRAASALSNRGAMFQRLGRHQDALACYEQALAIQPNDAETVYNRGTVLERLGRIEEALANYEQTLAIRHDHPEALCNCGNLLMRLQRLDQALARYDRALALRPDYVDALDSRGCVLLALKRPDQALESFDRVLSLRPDFTAAAFNRGNALKELKRFEEAIASYDRALETDPDNAGILNNRGNTFLELKRFEEALESYDRALAIRPDHIEALNNRGCALKELGQIEEALASYERALAVRPDFADAFNNRGNALLELGQTGEALASYDRSVDLNAQNAEYRFNRSLLLLLLGSFDEGWREYEWRRRRKISVERTFNVPEWEGEPVSGKRLLLYSEQGFGDTIQFARFARCVTNLGAQVILEVQAPLGGLLRRLDGEAIIVRRGEPLPEFDLRLPLVSVPFVLGLVPQRLPAEAPYLSADPVRVDLWSSRLPTRGLRVGIAWQGNPSLSTDKGRSIPLKAFAPLARISGVTLISLQKNTGVEQLADLPPGMAVETLGADLDAGPDAFVDTAAVMMNLDLIVSCDTAVAHLAGALGRPVWVLLRKAPDWRWMLDREDTPWYPTARLFRQIGPGDWDDVLNKVAAELEAFAAHPEEQLGRRYDPGSAIAPEDAEALYTRANILKGWGQQEAALAGYERALAIAPDHVEALNSRGMLLWELKRFDEALANYDRVLAVRPDHAAALNNRGNALWALRRFDEALTNYDRALAIRPDDPEVLNNRAGALLQAKRPDEALASYDEALRIQPRYAEALYGRGVALAQSGWNEDAIASYRQAVAIRPDYPEALNNLASVLQHLGRFEEALAGYDRALAVRPDDVIALTNRANALRRLGRLDEALANADRALTLQPGNAEALNSRKNALRELGRLAAAAPGREGAAIREILPRDHAVFVWQVSNHTGWGIVGLNLLLSWAKLYEPSLLTSVEFNEADLVLNPVERGYLSPAIERSRALQARLRAVAGGGLDVAVPVLHALGNGFAGGLSAGRVRLRGTPNIGMIVFESTRFPDEARERAKLCELLVTGSSWNREVLEQAGLGPAEVIFQGVDPSHFHPAPRAGWFADRFTVFSGGKLEFRKGQDLVLLAFRAFAERHPEALLVTAWSSPWPQFARTLEVNPAVKPVCFRPDGKIDAKAWALANGLRDAQVLDLGALSNAELPRLYREMDVALFPNRCEGGTNLVAMECMACGVPVVISDNTGHRDLIAADRCIPLQRQAAVPGADHLGWGESDIEEIVEALEAVWRDRAAARALGGRGAEFMTRLTWDHMARRVAEVVQPRRKFLPSCCGGKGWAMAACRS